MQFEDSGPSQVIYVPKCDNKIGVFSKKAVQFEECSQSQIIYVPKCDIRRVSFFQNMQCNLKSSV